jgi:hypothetical protein
LNFTDSYHDFNDNYKGADPQATVQLNGFVHRIGSWTTWDWQISYKFGVPEEPRMDTKIKASRRGRSGRRGKAILGPELLFLSS